MDAAPAMVSYAALAVAGGSLFLSVLTYRSGGPRVSLGVQQLAQSVRQEAVPIRLTVVNSGRAAVSVQHFGVKPYVINRQVPIRIAPVDGPALPFRLEAHATESWIVDALPAAYAFDKAVKGHTIKTDGSAPYRFTFVVTTGNGKHRKSNANWDALRLIADSKAP